MMVRIFRHFVSIPIIALLAMEFAMLIGAMYLGIALRFIGGDATGIAEILPIFPKAGTYAVLISVTMAAFGLYQREIVMSGWMNLFRYLASIGVGLILLILLFYVFPQLFLGRGAMGLTVIFTMTGLMITRTAFTRLVNHEAMKKRILVLGTGTRVSRLESLMNSDVLKHKFTLVGYLPSGNNQMHSINPEKILKEHDPLLRLALEQNVDEIVVGVRDRRGGGLPMASLLECRLEGISVIELSSFFERETGHVQLDSLNPSWMIFSDGFNQSSGRNTVKRIFDVVASLVLLLLTLPVMAVTALLIVIETGAPIMYRQLRVGEAGRPFEVYKFRSMRVDAEKGGKPQWASKDDDRVTRVGRIIRLLRIDELPQIFNVLRGHMSFVGPRPERPYFVEELSKTLPYYSSRHSVKPGITGWAQINYPYGASVEDSREKLQYDLYYAKNHSLFLDLIIIFQTVQVVLFGKGAR